MVSGDLSTNSYSLVNSSWIYNIYEPCFIDDKKLMFKAGGLVITNQTQRGMETVKTIKAVNKNLWTEIGEL